MENSTQIIALDANEIDYVDGAGIFMTAAAVISVAAALVYAGEVLHDMTCEDHD